MNGNSIVVDAAMALSVAVLSYFLYHLVQRRTAAEKAGRHVSHFPLSLRHPSRAVRIAAWTYCLLWMGFFLGWEIGFLHRLSQMPAESRGLLVRGLARDYGLVAGALALVFGLGALAVWVIRRRGEGGRA